MEIPKHPLTMNQSNFLSALRNIMSNPVYFFGSIIRGDYLPGLSDIDVLYFADNIHKETNDMYRFMQSQSHENPTIEVKKKRFLYHSKETTNIISGYKVKYTDLDGAIPIEVSIYDIKNKDSVLREQLTKANLPVPIIWFLIILKTMAYKFRMIPEETFKWLKERVFTIISGIPGSYLIFEDS